MTTTGSTLVSVTDIPRLDAPPAYTPLADPTGIGFPTVTLPSGHEAVHLTRYADVLAVLTDPTTSRSVTNVDNGPSFLPTTMPDEVPIRVNSLFLGLPLAAREYYRPLGHTVQQAPPDDVPGLLDDFWKLYGYVTELVRGEHDIEPYGLIARFVAGRAQSDPPLTDEELVAILLGSLLGADQNILSVLTKCVYALLVAQPVWLRLVREPAILPNLVEELIRLIPLGTMSAFPRVSTCPIETTHGTLPAGTVIYPDAFAANRDPAIYPDPLLVDVDRTGPRHLQFGYGMHHCMGAALARLEITEVIGRLAAEFPDLALDADPSELPWDDGVLLRRPSSLPVRW